MVKRELSSCQCRRLTNTLYVSTVDGESGEGVGGLGRVGCHAALLQLLIEGQAQGGRQGSSVRSVSEDTSCEGKGGTRPTVQYVNLIIDDGSCLLSIGTA